MRAAILLALVCGVLLGSPCAAQAATLYFEPATATLQKGQTVDVALSIAADESINTIGSAVRVPPGMHFMNATKGPLITQWVDLPNFDTARNEVAFSGIISGGWKGKAQLVVFRFAADAPGTFAFLPDPEATEVYKNDGKGTPEPVVFASAPPREIPWGLLAGALVIVLALVLLIKRTLKITFS